MKYSKWMKHLIKAIEDITYNEVEKWDPDAMSRRYPGQFGEFVLDFDQSFINLCICIDISEPHSFYEDYAEVIQFLDLEQRIIRDRFEKIHLNYWAEGFFIPYTIRIKKVIKKMGLFDMADEYFREAKESIDTKNAIVSNIFKPLIYGNDWYRLEPTLILVLLKGNLFNDMERTFKMKIKRFLYKTLWICVEEIEEPYLSTILDIDSKARERIILTKKV